jgi:hypothetical protein
MVTSARYVYIHQLGSSVMTITYCGHYLEKILAISYDKELSRHLFTTGAWEGAAEAR